MFLHLIGTGDGDLADFVVFDVRPDEFVGHDN